MLYKALVRSHLEYAGTVWSPYKIKYITALEQVWKRATKLVSKIKHLPYKDRLSKLELPTLVFRRLHGDMIEVFKILSGIYDQNTVPSMSLTLPATTTGHNKKLFKPFCNKNVRRKYFTVRVIETWNSLPHEFVNANSVNAFKKRLDKYWANEELHYNYHSTLNTGHWKA